MVNKITFPKLKDELYQSPLVQALQIQEESGELAEKIGLLLGVTGKRKEVPEDIVEQVAEEALDVAQSACGVLFALQSMFNIKLDKAIEKHIAKMKNRGYL